MKEKSVFHMMKIDFKRVFTFKNMLLSVLPSVFILIYSSFINLNYYGENGLYMLFYSIITGFPLTICLAICAGPYAVMFYEDNKNKYNKPTILRIGLKKYTLSKVLSIFSLSAFSMFISILISIAFFSFSHSVYGKNIDLQVFEWEAFGNLVLSKNHLLYFVMHSLQIGMFCGLLALLSVLISTFIKDKLLIYTIPFLFTYIYNELFSQATNGIKWALKFSIYNIYVSYTDVWYNHLHSIIYLFIITIVFVFLLFSGIYSRVKGAVRNE